MSRLLLIATLLFLGIASFVLVWEGLAAGVLHPRAGGAAALRRVRFRFAVGVLVFAAVVWIASGLLTHAW